MSLGLAGSQPVTLLHCGGGVQQFILLCRLSCSVALRIHWRWWWRSYNSFVDAYLKQWAHMCYKYWFMKLFRKGHFFSPQLLQERPDQIRLKITQENPAGVTSLLHIGFVLLPLLWYQANVLSEEFGMFTIRIKKKMTMGETRMKTKIKC